MLENTCRGIIPHSWYSSISYPEYGHHVKQVWNRFFSLCWRGKQEHHHATFPVKKDIGLIPRFSRWLYSLLPGHFSRGMSKYIFRIGFVIWLIFTVYEPGAWILIPLCYLLKFINNRGLPHWSKKYGCLAGCKISIFKTKYLENRFIQRAFKQVCFEKIRRID